MLHKQWKMGLLVLVYSKSDLTVQLCSPLTDIELRAVPEWVGSVHHHQCRCSRMVVSIAKNNQSSPFVGRKGTRTHRHNRQ